MVQTDKATHEPEPSYLNSEAMMGAVIAACLPLPFVLAPVTGILVGLVAVCAARHATKKKTASQNPDEPGSGPGLLVTAAIGGMLSLVLGTATVAGASIGLPAIVAMGVLPIVGGIIGSILGHSRQASEKQELHDMNTSLDAYKQNKYQQLVKVRKRAQQEECPVPAIKDAPNMTSQNALRLR